MQETSLHIEDICFSETMKQYLSLVEPLRMLCGGFTLPDCCTSMLIVCGVLAAT